MRLSYELWLPTLREWAPVTESFAQFAHERGAKVRSTVIVGPAVDPRPRPEQIIPGLCPLSKTRP